VNTSPEPDDTPSCLVSPAETDVGRLVAAVSNWHVEIIRGELVSIL
jgi:hypothetical protein